MRQKNFQLPKTFLILSKKVGKIRKVLHFENEIEHKILVTYVIAKVSSRLKTQFLVFRPPFLKITPYKSNSATTGAWSLGRSCARASKST